MKIPLFLLGRAGHKLNEPHKNSPKEYWRLTDIAQGFPWFSWMKGTGFLLRYRIVVHFPDRTDPDVTSVRDICFNRTDQDRVPGSACYIVKSTGNHRGTRIVIDVRKIEQESGTSAGTWSI